MAWVPVRQFVLSIPHRLRYVLAYDHDRGTAVLRIFIRALLAFYRRRARKRGVRDGRTGTVTFIQRFGSAANLNVHFKRPLHAHVEGFDLHASRVIHASRHDKRQGWKTCCAIAPGRPFPMSDCRSMPAAKSF